MNAFIISLALVGYAAANIDDKCLNCICQLESGCKALPCKQDPDASGKESCGYYQLKEAYLKDCKAGKDWKSCALDKACSTHCVKNYLAIYANKCNKDSKCETYAAVHIQGSNGCIKPLNNNYLARLSRCLAQG